MYFIALFGVLMVLLSLMMVATPGAWALAIVTFSEKPYFHPFEIVSRAVFGIVFVSFAEQTLHPTMNAIIGYVLLLVAAGLTLTPPRQHKRFAAWSAREFRAVFRPAGACSIAFGMFIVYSALGNVRIS